MSYSFQARGATKEAVKADVAAKMAVVVQQQPVHAKDAAQAIAAAGAFIDTLVDERIGKDGEPLPFVVTMNGSLGWDYRPDAVGDPTDFTSATVGVSAYFGTNA